jgi:hypothetical protein
MAKKRKDPEPLPPLRLEYVEAQSLQDNPSNWRTHPAAQLDALKDVLQEVGWAGALLYNERTGRLIDGHARKKISQGKEKVPVLVGNWTEEQEKKILATLDPIASMAEADTAKLDALLREIQTDSQPIQEMLATLAADSGILDNGNGQQPTEEELEDYLDEDGLDLFFKAPFPWFGGKARVAKEVWQHFGDIPSYIEPFFGSGAVLLNRPLPPDAMQPQGVETVNDLDGLVCNFWRALQQDPDAVAQYADWPVNENDLHARHIWLVERKDTLQERLEGDPDYCDAKIAGWWVWGMACWIGGGFCSGEGPWQMVEEDGVRQLVHLGNAGQGVQRRRVQLGNAGQGINLVGDQPDGNPGIGECGLLAWMRALAERLRRVRVCCGDWTRVCGGNSGDAFAHFFAAGDLCGIFLDPPYADTANRTDSIYRQESLTVAHAVRDWAIAHGDDPRLRIALCGYQDEHQMPADWKMVKWKAHGGMAGLGNNQGKLNKFRERIWFNKSCLNP